MNVKHVILAGAVGLLVGFVAGWAVRSDQSRKDAPGDPTANAAAGDPIPQPDRPPDYYGSVEAIAVYKNRNGKLYPMLLVHCRPVPPDRPQPTQNTGRNGKLERVWVRLEDGPFVGPEAYPGAMVTVWQAPYAPVITTYPGQVIAEYVVSEPKPR
jgi:hypothetical protein